MPTIDVRVPAPLRPLAGGRKVVSLEAGTVADAVEHLGPRIQQSVLDERGRLRPFVNLFLNQRNVRDLGGLSAPVAEGDVLHIIPAVAGG